MNTETEISKKQFIKDVVAELKNIKKHATFEEIENLDFLNFKPSNTEGCIYGQMTGHCRSKRAKELIVLCCNKFVKQPSSGKVYNDFEYFQHYIQRGDISEVQKKFYEPGYSLEYFSSLEAYIMLKTIGVEFSHKKIFAFLKGEIDSIKL